MPLLRGRRAFAVLLVLAVVSLLLFIRSTTTPTYSPVEDDYAPYNKPSSNGKNSLLHYHDTDLFDTPTPAPPTTGKWVPEKWKPTAWLPDLPFLSSPKTQHAADGKRGRILITGGTGSLGIPLVDRLLKEGFAVTLHDVRDPLPRDTEFIRRRNPRATVGGRLAFVKGDISVPKHVSALMAELTAPLTGKTTPTEDALRTGRGLIGIIHLAGISRDIWCASRPTECESLNVRGTTNLFEALDEATRSVEGGRRPWFLHFSSLDVYEAETGVVPLEVEALTPLGRSKARAERALEEAYHAHLSHLSSSSSDADAPSGEGIRTIILRPSTIYGHPTDIQDRLVPALVRNALADLPVQVMHDRPVDFIEVGDALDGVVGAVERLMGREAVEETKMEELAGKKRQLPVSGPMFETYDLVSGYTATPKQLLDMIMRLTQSLSPIQDYTTQPTTTKLPLLTLDPSPSLRSKLGFQPSVSLDQGIAGYVSTVRQSVTDWARDYLGAECPESLPYGDPMVIHDADRRNNNIQRLAGCTANIGVNHEGWIHHVKCGDSTCDADNIKASSYNWNQSIFTILPYGAEPPSGDDAGGGKWGWAFGLLGTERKDGATTPMRVQFVEGNTKKMLGFVKREAPEGGRQYVKLGLFDPVEAGNASEIVTVFEPRVASNASYLQFTIPGTNEYLAVESQLDVNRFSVNTLEETSPFDFRMTLLCCPTDKPWPLLLDDYETADFRYGSTGDIPFNSSKRLHECRRVEMALERMESLLTPAPIESGMGTVQRPLAITTTKQPHDWALRGLPTCMNHCDNPMVCVQNGHCRCIQADECATERANPLTPLELPTGHDLISITTNQDFVKAVDKLRWQDVLLPSAMRVLETYPDLIKVHVVSGYEGEAEIEAAECHKLDSTHCFSADSIMYRAMRSISVPAEQADLVIIPVYQHCDGAPFLLHDVMEYASKTIPNFAHRAVSLVLTHDWGICVQFAWNIWEARTNNRLHPDWILNNVFVWSVMGDTVTNCYRPHMDTVIPARTCNSAKLRESFGDIGMVTPIAQRTQLLTWAGTMWGTGKSARMRLVCERGGAATEELVPGGGRQSSFLNWDYMKDLSGARFCPQPAGIAGWSFRVQDAIYAGCIPVFMSDGTHYPFADILDYSKFSVRVSPTEFDHLEHILRGIPLEKVESMQAHLIAIREAFLYSTDEHPEEELERRGPLWFALQSARVRLSTEYPMNATITE